MMAGRIRGHRVGRGHGDRGSGVADVKTVDAELEHWIGAVIDLHKG